MEENPQNNLEHKKSMAEKLKESIEERQAQQAGGGEEVHMPQQKKETKSGVNKYIIIGIIVVLFFGVGIGFRAFFVPEAAKPVVTCIERELTIVVNQNTWRFNPEFIEADQGDKMILTIINEDDYDHGFAIDAFGISQRMPARGTVLIEFVVTKAGDFPYYCSVSCGSGVVHGEERGHFDQIGRIHVRSLISETVDFVSEPTVDFVAEARKAAMLKEANRYAEKFGFTDDVIAVIDGGNILWEQYVAEKRFGIPEIKSLENIDFQAIYFKGDLSRISPFWILIDTTTGEVIRDVTANDGVDS